MDDDPDHDISSDTTIARDDEPTGSLDTVLEVVANQRRRFTLYSLIDSAEEAVSLATLIEDVATLEAAHTNDALTRDHYVSVAADLYHWHVEVLADVGIVEYDKRSRTVWYRPQPLVETWVERIRQDELSCC